MPKGTCSVATCDRPCHSHGFCLAHGRRWRRYGDPLGSYDASAKMAHAISTFWSKVEKTDSCWLWRGKLNPKGYGQTPNAVLPSAMAHRIAYILVKGPIADDPATGKTLELDHLCHTPTCRSGNACPHRACVNPDHLEPVTHTENIRRGDRCGGRETCGRGHSRARYSRVNINGHRFCGECARVDSLKRYRKRVELKPLGMPVKDFLSSTARSTRGRPKTA